MHSLRVVNREISVCWLTHLAHETERHPLIIGVIHHVLALPLPRALALVGRRDVEAGVHPAVGLQRPLAHTAPGLTRSGKLCEFENYFVYQVTLDRLPEELIGGHDEGAEDEEGGGVSVEQAECPVIY